MEKQTLRKSLRGASFIIASAVFATACQDYAPMSEDDIKYGVLKPASEYFSFNTTGEVALSVDYGKRGGKALIEVSVENPAYVGMDGNTYYRDNAIFKAFCDENGRYSGNITLPTYAENVYVYTMRQGVPHLLSAPITNGSTALLADGDADVIPTEGIYPPGYSIEAVNADKQANRFRVIAESEEEDPNTNRKYKIWEAPQDGNGGGNLYTIVNWTGQRFARTVKTQYTENYETTKTYFDDQGLIEDRSDSETFAQELTDIGVVQKFLWGGKTSKPSDLNNSQYLTTTGGVNTVIPYTYIDSDGKTQNIEKGVQVYMKVLAEGARYMDGVGYYYYPTDNPPIEASDLTLYLAVPNASLPGTGNQGKPFRKTFSDEGGIDESYWGYDKKFVPFKINQRVQLLYHKEVIGDDGERHDIVSRYFPPGTTIGYFLLSKQATQTSNPIGTTMTINRNPVYSNSEFNSFNGKVGGKDRFLALNYKKDVIYGVEDGVDASLEDVLFAIETDPEGINNDEDYPTIDEDDKNSLSEYRTYAYEDIWPTGGDYDINDVVIDHHRHITFTSDNKVTEIVDTFRTVHPYNAATYVDAFAIQIPEKWIAATATHELYIGKAGQTAEFVTDFNDAKRSEYYEEKTRSVIFSKNTMRDLDMVYILKRTFKPDAATPLKLEDARLEQSFTDEKYGGTVMRNILNPYIISKWNTNSDVGRTEIHLPKHEVTPFGKNDFGEKEDAYFINKDGEHPFAISIPIGVKSGPKPHFIVKSEDEGTQIDEIYPRFESWAESGGTKDADWYLHYNPKNP